METKKENITIKDLLTLLVQLVKEKGIETRCIIYPREDRLICGISPEFNRFFDGVCSFDITPEEYQTIKNRYINETIGQALQHVTHMCLPLDVGIRLCMETVSCKNFGTTTSFNHWLCIQEDSTILGAPKRRIGMSYNETGFILSLWNESDEIHED